MTDKPFPRRSPNHKNLKSGELCLGVALTFLSMPHNNVLAVVCLRTPAQITSSVVLPVVVAVAANSTIKRFAVKRRAN
jgi:energy-converting hydrogenase Eha subunit E